MPSIPSLIVVGKKEGELSLGADVTVIGRDKGVTLELADFQVSRRHALVIKTEDGCWVKDLGSRNGVLLNKARVPARRQQRLKNGDVLTLGKTAIVFKDLEVGPLPEEAVKLLAAPPVEAKPAEKPVERAADKPAEKPVEKAAEKPLEKATLPPQREPAVVEVPAAAAPSPAARPRFQELAADDAAAAGPTAAPRDRGDQVALRQLLRRAEDDRVFYRNLTLVLVGFLMLLLVILLFHAMGRTDRPADDGGAPKSGKAAKTTDGPPPAASSDDSGPNTHLQRVPGPVSVPLGRAGELDARVFADTVQPLLMRTCATAGCHQSHSAGDLVLEGKTDPPGVSRDLDVVRRFVVPGRPERSPLLTKALKRDEGGEEHGGGDILSASSPAYQTLRDWIAKAAPRPEDDERPRPRPPFAGTENENASATPTAPRASHRPIARISASATAAKPGVAIALDASASSDSEGCALHFQWTLIDRPEGSRSEISQPLTANASLTLDAEGSYLVALTATDGPNTSEPAKVSIDCAKASAQDPGGSPAATPTSRPVARGGLLKDDPQGRVYVREVMIDLLGRGPTPAEAQAALDRTREDFVQDLLSKDELYSEWYEQELLYFLLIDNFRPADEVTDIPRKLKAKEMTVKDAIHATVIGQYFNQRNPGNDTFVTVVLEQLLGLKVQERPNKKLLDAGKKMYDGYAATLFGRMGNKQADIVRIVVGERGFTEHFLKRTYKRVTGMDLDKDELAAYADRLEKDWGSFFALEKEWVLSPKYVAQAMLLRQKSERAFIRTLFVDVLQRPPEEEDLRNARNAVRALADPGPLKAVLAKVLLDSPKAKLSLEGDAESFVKTQFERLLARDPKPMELAVYKKALDEGTARETVVRALVTSTEYEGY